MERILVTASHHKMAEGLKQTLEFVSGGGQKTVALSAYVDNSPVEETIKGLMDGFDPEDEMDEQELRSQLMKAIDELNEQERTVLSLYYYEDLTMREIGQVLGVSEQRVGQINQKLIRKLREKRAYYTKG